MQVAPTVAIIAPGTMGAGVAGRLTAHGVRVSTSLKDRSAASIARAKAAGMEDADDRALAQSDLVLSIVPPGDALALAQRLAPALTAANKKPVYVDCNAVNPATVNRIEAVIAATGCAFAGAGIIGPPPKEGATNTKIYVSGPAAGEVARLNDYGLIVHVLDGAVTAASALKMSYAGITKGLTALAATMLLAAQRGGADAALHAELAESQPHLLAYFNRSVPGMYSKAYRWVAEMDEIAGFVGDARPEHEMLSAAARLYENLAADHDGDKRETAALSKFLGP